MVLTSWFQNIIQAKLARLANTQKSGHFDPLKQFYSDLEQN